MSYNVPKPTPYAEKGVANGVATLDSGAKVPVAQIPSGVCGDGTQWIKVFGDGTGDYTTLTAALAAHTESGARFIVSGTITEPDNSWMIIHSNQHIKFVQGVTWNWGYACTFANCTYADSPTSYSGISIESEGAVAVRILTGHALAPGASGINRRYYSRFYIRGSYGCVDFSRAIFNVTQRNAITTWYPEDALPIAAEFIVFLVASGCNIGKWVINHRIDYTGSTGFNASTGISAIYSYWNCNRNTIDVDVIAFGATAAPVSASSNFFCIGVMGGACYGNHISGVIHDSRWITARGTGVHYGGSGTGAGAGIVKVSWNSTNITNNTIPATCKDLTTYYTTS